MSLLLIALLVLLLAGVAGWLLLRRPPAGPPDTAPAAPVPQAATLAAKAPSSTAAGDAAAAATAAAPPRPAPAAAALPEALRSFRPVAHGQLAEAERAALVQRLVSIPPPPLALHKLVSPEFLEAARPSALADTIMAEAQIAARLLATVNSPRYGLRKPVASVVQAVSLLGLNTVRALCMQHLLHNSFAGATPAHRDRLDRLLRTSTCASTLCGQLATALQLPEPGTLVTQCVLSFLGPLACTVLLQPGSAAWGPHARLLERSLAEQQALGLAAGELGALLMQAWGLPPAIVAEVRDVDRLLFTPAHLVDPRQAPRLALCYLSARLGERLAQGQVDDPADLRLDTPGDADFCHLHGYLALPALAGVPAALQSEAVLAPLRPLLGTPQPA